MRPQATLTALLLTVFSGPLHAAEHSADVVVYGGTAGGVVAAVAAAREGRRVLLTEPGRHVGGMVSGGLGASDTGNRAAIGGYSREFFDRVRAYYVGKYGQSSPQVKDCSDGFRFEPHVAERIFREMLAEVKVTPLFEQRLVKVAKKGPRITSFTTSKGDSFTAAVFIDASYEGDLMAQAGVRYHVGREGRDVYKEPLAGVQAFSRAHQWPVKIDGRLGKGLLPLVQEGPLGRPGEGDRKVQAYNFRLCMTARKDNLVPWPKPREYDPARFELLARYLKARPDVTMGQLMHPVPLPNGKTDTNNNGPLSTDHIGASWDYPEADHARRQRIWQDHVAYTQGFFWFLAHDPRVPARLQQEVRGWGLAKDEFPDTAHWPHQLYVREARRMVGQYVMTQADITDARQKDDAVGLGSYNADSHHVQRVLRDDGSVLNEGDFQVPVAPYAIPYGSLVPKKGECDNLLVPVCMSASHVAYGTIRMEPVYMILGQATGVAASLAARDRCGVQDVDIKALTSRLKEQKAILSPAGLSGRASSVRQLDPANLPGVVVDDTAARLSGEWKTSRALGPFVGTGYLHDDNADKGKKTARFVPRLPAAGRYEVRLYYSPGSNRARNARVVVQSKAGAKEIRVDQRKAWKGDGGMSLGVFTFEAGESGWVEVSNAGTTGHVIADAVGFVPQRESRGGK